MRARAARIAGGTPPTTPMRSAKTRTQAISHGVMRNAKARWENICQFMVPVVRPLSGRTTTQPTEPDCAHRGDLARALRNRRVHRVQRPEDRANTHHDGHDATEHGDQQGELARLLRVVVDLAIDLHGKATSNSMHPADGA